MVLASIAAMELGRAARMARETMDEHGLDGWTFAFDRARVRAGACHFRDRRITLSRAITAAQDEAEVQETVLHEVAHALVGPRHGHDAVWRRTARSIGATGERCYSVDQPVVPGRWQGRCAAGHVVHRHRRPERLLLCARCRGVPDRDRALCWSLDGRPVPPEQLGPQVAQGWRQLQDPSAAAGSDGRPPGTLRPGELVRITAPGRYHGVAARVLSRGRTCYTVQAPGVRLRVRFEAVRSVEPA